MKFTIHLNPLGFLSAACPTKPSRVGFRSSSKASSLLLNPTRMDQTLLPPPPQILKGSPSFPCGVLDGRHQRASWSRIILIRGTFASPSHISEVEDKA